MIQKKPITLELFSNATTMSSTAEAKILKLKAELSDLEAKVALREKELLAFDEPVEEGTIQR